MAVSRGLQVVFSVSALVSPCQAAPRQHGDLYSKTCSALWETGTRAPHQNPTARLGALLGKGEDSAWGPPPLSRGCERGDVPLGARAAARPQVPGGWLCFWRCRAPCTEASALLESSTGRLSRLCLSPILLGKGPACCWDPATLPRPASQS